MPTIKAVVLKHHQKSDGSYNVKIRISHCRASRYLDTNHFVSSRQLTKKFEIKDSFLIAQLNKVVDGYRAKISGISDKVEFLSCGELAEFLSIEDRPIDFIAFSKEHVEKLKANERVGSSIPLRAVVNSLVDYFKREQVLISEINAKMLYQYEDYLRGHRILVRNHRKTSFVIQSPGLSDGGLHNHMRDLRTLFNAARDRYNDEDLGIIRIAHYPFKKYKLINRPETIKRNLKVDQVQMIISHTPTCVREELARDLFILSFIFCGTNSVDFYNMDESNIKDGRLEYNRAKTKNKRADRAFISIKIVPQAVPLLEKYLGKLQKRYSSRIGLSSALSYGMRKMRPIHGNPYATFYWGRGAFATIARNVCRKSKDDVAQALNHVDEGRKTTDIYIEKDWEIVDEVQQAVLANFSIPYS